VLRCSNDPDDCAPCVTIGDACDANEDCCDWSPFARVYCGAGTCRVE
jgi:hypothetical protein